MSHAPIHTDIFFFDKPNLAKKNRSSERALRPVNIVMIFSYSAPFGYYPYLDEYPDESVDYLRDLVMFAMARITTLPPLRFQRTRVEWDANNIYVTTTMVGDGDIPSKLN